MNAVHPLPPEDLMAYLDGEVTGGEARDIQVHLAGCAECQRLSADLRDGSIQLREWQVEEPPPTMVAPPFRQHPHTHFRWFSGAFGWALAARRPLVASAGLVVVIVAVISMQSARKPMVRSDASTSNRVGGRLNTPSSIGEAVGLLNAPAASPLADGFSAGPRAFAPGEQGQNGQQGQAGFAGRPVGEPDPTGPRIVRTAMLRIVATDFSGVRAAIDRILQSSGGFVGSITASDRPGAPRSIRGDLRIPSGRFEMTLGALRGLGRVTEDSQNAEDVTATVVDLDVRISNARATEKRLSEVLQNRTGRLSDVLEVEREIMRVRTEIEQMESQHKQLDGRVDYATLTIEVQEERRAGVNLGPIPVPTRLRQAVADGLESAAMSMVDAALLILRSGPILLLWLTLLGLPVWWLLRRYAFRESRQPDV